MSNQVPVVIKSTKLGKPSQKITRSILTKLYGYERQRKHFAVALELSDYFSVTGEYGVKRYGQILANTCGCMHEDIAKKFPRFAKYIKWHLVNSDGTPMHYVANALYHLGIGKYGEFKWEHFKSTVIFGAIEEQPLPTEPNQENMTEWLNERLPRLQAAFKADMQELGFTVSE